MITSFRKASKSWLAAGFIGLIALSFAVWGLNDVLAPSSTAAITVGGQRVTPGDLRVDYTLALRRIANETGRQPTPEEAAAQGIPRDVMNGQIVRATLRDAADRLGVVATDQMVETEYQTREDFKNPTTGAFDPVAAVNLLREVGLTPRSYEEIIRGELIREQLISAAASGVTPPAPVMDMRTDWVRERRVLELVRLPEAAIPSFADYEPSEAEIEDAYTANLSRYRTPERRAITIVRFDVADYEADVTVTPEEIAAAYEAEKDRRTDPERRSFIQLLAPDQATAETVAARLAAGEAAETIATELSLQAPRPFDGVRQAEVFDPAVAEAAFALAEAGAVSAPSEGPLFWSVLRVDAIRPARTPSLEEISGELTDTLRRDRATEAMFLAVETFEAARNRGATLEDAASDAEAIALTLAPVDRSGNFESGDAAAALTSHPVILERAFEQAPGLDSAMTELGETGFFALRVDEIVAPADPPLDAVRAEATLDARQALRRRALDELSAKAEESLQSGLIGEFAAAAVHPLATGETRTLTRFAGGEDLGFFVQQAFGADVGASVRGVAQNPQTGEAAFIVARVKSADRGPEVEPEFATQIAAVTEQELNTDIAELLITAWQAQAPAKINQPLVDQVFGTETQ